MSDEEEPSEYEEALSNCGQFCSGGFVVCSLIGSEDCDWCPFHDEIGEPVEDNDNE